MKKIFLDDIPRKKGKCCKINWSQSLNIPIRVVYDDIDIFIKITDIKDNRNVVITSDEYGEFIISNNNLYNCKLGKYLKKVTDEFKLSINQRFVNDKRDITIVKRENIVDNNGKIRKCYKIICNRCSGTKWIAESGVINGSGCSYCGKAPRKIIEEINSIVAKKEYLWMIPYFQGGYEEAKLYAPHSSKYIYFKCPYCGTIKKNKTSVGSLAAHKGFKCVCSRDGFSYPEKIIYKLLEQLKIEFKTQLTSHNYDWCKKYRYDFYFDLSESKCIIEAHGKQHYEEIYRGRSLEKEQENDASKRALALSNGINFYIEIDCRESKLEWIKNSILNSKLNELFDLSSVDWLKCEEFASSGFIKEVCEYWNSKEEWETTTDLASIFGLAAITVSKYLKIGNSLGLVNYNADEERVKANEKISKINTKNFSKKVAMCQDSKIIKIFNSCTEASNESLSLIGCYLNTNGITRVCRGERYHYKGYRFHFLDDNGSIVDNFEAITENKVNRVIIKKGDLFIGEYESVKYIYNNSINILGIQVTEKGVYSVCNNYRKTYKGYTFIYKY